MKKLHQIKTGQFFQLPHDLLNYYVRGKGATGKVYCLCYRVKDNSRYRWLDRNFDKNMEVLKYTPQ